MTQTLKKYSVNFDEYSNSYDFTDGVNFPEEFLNTFDTKFISNGDKNLIFKGSFVRINYQPPAFEGGVSIYDSRFWSSTPKKQWNKLRQFYFFTNKFFDFPVYEHEINAIISKKNLSSVLNLL